MLLQIHHQFIDYSKGEDRFELIAQKEISSNEEMAAWMKSIEMLCPLPVGACWFICNDKDKHFIVKKEAVDL